MSKERPKLCDECRSVMVALLDQRIRKILEEGRKDREERLEKGLEVDDDGLDIGQSHCFHLMEIQRILRGEHTCGVYDDYGKPPTIEGPLFTNV